MSTAIKPTPPPRLPPWNAEPKRDRYWHDKLSPAELVIAGIRTDRVDLELYIAVLREERR